MNRTRRRAAAAVLLSMTWAAAACAGGPVDRDAATADRSDRVELTLAAPETSQPGFAAVIDGFRNSPEGTDLTVDGRYGASAALSRRIARGMPADVVGLSAWPEMQRLVDAGAVDPTWDSGAGAGTPYGSVVALVVREGNPLGIRGWDDLLRPDVQVITPDPRASGAAMWNLAAPYAAMSHGGRDRRAGLDYIRALVSGHVSAQPASSRAATEMFLAGSGDVLIGYENEAIRMARDGADVEHVIPSGTVRVEYPFAVTARSGRPDGASAFMQYLYSREGQRLWAENGYRPVDPAVVRGYSGRFPEPPHLYTVDDLGGWETVYTDLFDPDGGAITAIYADAAG